MLLLARRRCSEALQISYVTDHLKRKKASWVNCYFYPNKGCNCLLAIHASAVPRRANCAIWLCTLCPFGTCLKQKEWQRPLVSCHSDWVLIRYLSLRRVFGLTVKFLQVALLIQEIRLFTFKYCQSD